MARFPFTNVSQHVVRLVEVQTGGDYLRLKTQQKEFKPGEAEVLEFELDPSVLGMNTEQALSLAVALKTDPGGVYTRLTIGAVFEPAAAAPRGLRGRALKAENGYIRSTVALQQRAEA